MLLQFRGTRRFPCLLLRLLLLALALLAGCDGSGPQTDSTFPNPGPFRVDQSPAWSPDGSGIAYFRDARRIEDTTNVSGLYVRNLETDSTRLVVEGPTLDPDWHPDGTRIAFSADDIFTVRPDGSGLRRVTSFGSSFFPRWSPDGQTITFGRSGTLEQVGVWFAHLADSSFTRFGWVASPADWSPNGERIVYENEDQLWTADTSRTDSTQLTDNDFVINRGPAWSPNGEWIAWSAADGPEEPFCQVRVMRADGSGGRTVAECAASLPVSWSPDSKRLAFTGPDPDSDFTALWIVRRDGTGLRQITDPTQNPLN